MHQLLPGRYCSEFLERNISSFEGYPSSPLLHQYIGVPKADFSRVDQRISLLRSIICSCSQSEQMPYTNVLRGWAVAEKRSLVNFRNGRRDLFSWICHMTSVNGRMEVGRCLQPAYWYEKFYHMDPAKNLLYPCIFARVDAMSFFTRWREQLERSSDPKNFPDFWLWLEKNNEYFFHERWRNSYQISPAGAVQSLSTKASRSSGASMDADLSAFVGAEHPVDLDFASSNGVEGRFVCGPHLVVFTDDGRSCSKYFGRFDCRDAAGWGPITENRYFEKYLYIITCDGRLFIESPLMTHNILYNGGIVACAGEISFSDGKISYIDTESGHYRPSPLHMRKALLLMGRRYGMRSSPEQCISKIFHERAVIRYSVWSLGPLGTFERTDKEVRSFDQIEPIINHFPCELMPSGFAKGGRPPVVASSCWNYFELAALAKYIPEEDQRTPTFPFVSASSLQFRSLQDILGEMRERAIFPPAKLLEQIDRLHNSQNVGAFSFKADHEAMVLDFFRAQVFPFCCNVESFQQILFDLEHIRVCLLKDGAYFFAFTSFSYIKSRIIALPMAESLEAFYITAHEMCAVFAKFEYFFKKFGFGATDEDAAVFARIKGLVMPYKDAETLLYIYFLGDPRGVWSRYRSLMQSVQQQVAARSLPGVLPNLFSVEDLVLRREGRDYTLNALCLLEQRDLAELLDRQRELSLIYPYWGRYIPLNSVLMKAMQLLHYDRMQKAKVANG